MVGDCKSPARRAWSFARVSAPVWRARVTTAGLTAAAKVWSSRISARRRSPLRAMAASCAEGTQRRHLGSEHGFTTSSPPAPAASTSRFRAVARARARVHDGLGADQTTDPVPRHPTHDRQARPTLGRRRKARLHPPLGKRGVVQHALLAVAQRDRGGRGILIRHPKGVSHDEVHHRRREVVKQRRQARRRGVILLLRVVLRHGRHRAPPRLTRRRPALVPDRRNRACLLAANKKKLSRTHPPDTFSKWLRSLDFLRFLFPGTGIHTGALADGKRARASKRFPTASAPRGGTAPQPAAVPRPPALHAPRDRVRATSAPRDPRGRSPRDPPPHGTPRARAWSPPPRQGRRPRGRARVVASSEPRDSARVRRRRVPRPTASCDGFPRRRRRRRRRRERVRAFVLLPRRAPSPRGQNPSRQSARPKRPRRRGSLRRVRDPPRPSLARRRRSRVVRRSPRVPRAPPPPRGPPRRPRVARPSRVPRRRRASVRARRTAREVALRLVRRRLAHDRPRARGRRCQARLLRARRVRIRRRAADGHLGAVRGRHGRGRRRGVPPRQSRRRPCRRRRRASHRRARRVRGDARARWEERSRTSPPSPPRTSATRRGRDGRRRVRFFYGRSVSGSRIVFDGVPPDAARTSRASTRVPRPCTSPPWSFPARSY